MATTLSATSVFTAATGMKLPVIGLGTFQLDKEQEAVDALNSALELGYRHIDTAYLYYTEAIIGRVLQEWFKSGRLKREDVFVTTKLPPSGNRPEHVREFLKMQLKDLQLDYVDLYLIHHAVSWKREAQIHIVEGDTDNSGIQLDPTTDHIAVWKEMEKLVDDKLARYIGLSNFNTRQIERILKNARIPPSNLQVELHAYQQSKEEQEFCRERGIILSAYSTLGSNSTPQGLVVGNMSIPMEDPVVKGIAASHGKTPAQVLLRHALQLGAAVIPMSINPQWQRENLDLFDFELTEADMQLLNALDLGEEGRRYMAINVNHPEWPYGKNNKTNVQ